jgi:hypothetical protein
MQSPQDSEPANASLNAGGNHGAPTRIEGSLGVRCAALIRKMSEMREVSPTGKSQAQAENESLRLEKLQLQEQLEKRGREFALLTEKYRSMEAYLCEREQHYQQVLAEAEAVLTEQGAEIERLVAGCTESKVEQPELNVPPKPERMAERDEELRLLRAELAQKDQLIQEFQALEYAARLGLLTESVDLGEVDKLRSELARALEQLAATEGMLSTQRLAEDSRVTGEISSIQKEMTRLRVELADKEKTIQNSVPASKVEELIAELARARREVAELQPHDSSSNNSGELEQLKAEVMLLQEELREKDRQLKVKQAMAGSPDSAEDAQIAAQYEVEMVRYHRELEADRELLNGFVRDLRRRNAELAQAAERTQQELALERSQLLLLRDELRIDLAFEDLAFLARKHLAPLRKEAGLPGSNDADNYSKAP